MKNWKSKKNQNKIHEVVSISLQKLFPKALKQHSEEINCLTEETTERQRRSSKFFDIAYEFKEPVMNKQFVVVDYYIRSPITDNTVRSFLGKIRFARNEKERLIQKSRKRHYTLRGKTLGILVGKTVSQKAFTVAKRHGISVLCLADFNINTNNLTLHREQINRK